MIIRGKEFSEETIAEALQKHCNFEEKKKIDIFQTGDVVLFDDWGGNSFYRILLRYKGELLSFDLNGQWLDKEHNKRQNHFKLLGYKKVGTLADFIKN